MSTDQPSLTTEFLKRKIAELERKRLVDEDSPSDEIADFGDGTFTIRAHEEAGATPQNRTMATESDLRKEAIAAAEARTDTKIARLEGKLDLVISKLDDVREDGRSTRANMWVIGVSLALLIIGVTAAAPVIFDLGMKMREGISKEIQEQVHKAAPKQ